MTSFPVTDGTVVLSGADFRVKLSVYSDGGISISPCSHDCWIVSPVKRHWATTWQNQHSDYAPSEDSDQPEHKPSLIRVFAVCMMKAWTLSYPFSAQRRLWSDLVDAQADLRLHWVHSFCWFCHVVAHFKNYCAVEDSYFQKHWLVIT